MKMKAAPKKHEHKHYHLRHAVPVTVWLVAVASVTWLFYQRAQRFEIVGIARGQILQISPSSAGRVKDIRVEQYDTVTTGQTLAVIDTILDNEQGEEAKLRADVSGVAAEILHLTAQLVPTQEQMQAETSNLEMNRAGDLGRLAAEVDGCRLQALKLQVSIADDRIEVRRLASQIKILEQLAGDEAIAPYEVESAKVQHESVAKRMEENEKLLAQARQDQTQAQKRLDDFLQRQIVRPSEDRVLEVIRKQINVQEERMNGLFKQIDALKSRESVELKSPIDGIVVPISVRDNEALHQRPGELVMRRAGEVVRAGDPILAVAEKEPSEIVAYVNEQQLGLLQENMSVELVKIRTPAQITRSKIGRIGPTIELIPQRLWRNPNMPQWGRPVVIEIPPKFSLVAGEVVGIRGL